MTYWLNVRDDDKIASEENDLSATCKLTDTLDKVCLELGVLAVSEFVDSTEMSREFDDEFDLSDDDDEFYEEGKRPYPLDDMRWCATNSGLETFRALQTHLNESPETFKLDLDDIDMLAEELDEIIELLEEASAQGRTFHLELLG
ncbi:MAG: hypothetical protein QJT81_02095 [Candidatus Thiothrix putei]|uniref:Uncharacterized protein n=1 Tax=Candidatus Thiothrix putei TaxID=3080811 RepID=A0AA95HCH4_9GAMM|nr:MAG: hypothetical protein QJT81_02095 [Candidatus Thiothrix putei]